VVGRRNGGTWQEDWLPLWWTMRHRSSSFMPAITIIKLENGTTHGATYDKHKWSDGLLTQPKADSKATKNYSRTSSRWSCLYMTGKLIRCYG
jgi:hypothetical protein